MRLLEAVAELGIKEMWPEIAEFVPNRNNHECKARHKQLISNEQLAMGPAAEETARKLWMEEGERDMFIRAIEKVGIMDWKQINKEVGVGLPADKVCGLTRCLSREKH